MNLVEQKVLRQIVRSEFEKIRAKNPAYSQRAFAKKIGLHSGTLSGLLQGKRPLSATTTRKILARLQLDQNYRQWLSQILQKEKGASLAIERVLIDLERFEAISAPIHLNVLNVLRTAGAERTVAWAARRLGVRSAEVSGALERLERAGLVTREGQKFLPTTQALCTPEHFPHHAVRAFHRNTLAEASAKLEAVPVALRDFSAVTIPGDPAKIAQVRDLIAKFRDEVSFLLGAEPGTEVFKLAVQFYPVTISEEP